MVKELLGKKIGMTQVFQPSGECVGVTVLEVGPCTFLEKVTYPTKTVVKIGYGSIKEKHVHKPVLGYFKKLNQTPKRFIKEVPVDPTAPQDALTPGKDLTVELFEKDFVVDVTGVSIGRGFQGGMKRHGWSGQPRAHGHTSHRRIGSNGANTDPGRVVRGHRMPGHYGDATITVRNLEVIRTDKDKNLLFLRGAVPGATNGYVVVRKAKVPRRKKIIQEPLAGKKDKKDNAAAKKPQAKK